MIPEDWADVRAAEIVAAWRETMTGGQIADLLAAIDALLDCEVES